jgi:alginate O-acetyltransferase complex protein AlgJ
MNREAGLYTALFCITLLVTGMLAATSLRSFHAPEHVQVLNGELAKAIETHYEANFPGKQLGVNLWAAIDYTLFNEGRPGVVVGNQGWLYTDEEFDVAADARASVAANLAAISKARAALASEGVQLVAAVVPAKARVYAEHIADRKPARAHEAAYDALVTALNARHIPTADLRDILTSGKSKEPTYFRTDTHWTPWGAHLAANEIARVTARAGLAPESRAAYITRRQRRDAHRGDLCNFLPLAPYFTQLLPPRESVDVMHTDAAEPAGNTDLFGDSDIPSVVLVGTSYSANPLWNFVGALKQSLGAEIASYAREGAGPFRPMAAYLQSEDFRSHPPRLVIWEIPERTLFLPPRTVTDTAAQTL